MSNDRLHNLLFVVLTLCIFEKPLVYGMEVTKNKSQESIGEEIDIDSRYADLAMAVLVDANEVALEVLLASHALDLDFFKLPVIADALKENTICPRVICAFTRHMRLQEIAWSSLPNYFREAALLAAILENADDNDLRFLLEKEGASLSFFNSPILIDALERNSIDARVIRALTVYARLQGMDWLSFPDYFREAAVRARVFNKLLLIVLQGDLKGVIHALSVDRNLLVHSGVQARDLAQAIQAQDIVDYLNIELDRIHAVNRPVQQAPASSSLSLAGLSLRSRPTRSTGYNFSFNPLIAIVFTAENSSNINDLEQETLSHLNDSNNPLPLYMRDDAANLILITANPFSDISYFQDIFQLANLEDNYGLLLVAIADRNVGLVNSLLYFPGRHQLEYARGRADAPTGAQVSQEEAKRTLELVVRSQEETNSLGLLNTLNGRYGNQASLLGAESNSSELSTELQNLLFAVSFMEALSAEDTKKAKSLLEEYSFLLSPDLREAYPAIALYINGRDLSQLPDTMHNFLRDIVAIILPNPAPELYFASRSNPQVYDDACRAAERMPLNKIKRLLHLSVIFNRSAFLKKLVSAILNARDRRPELSTIDVEFLLEIAQNLASQSDLPSALRADYNDMLENLSQLLPAQNTGLNHDTPPVNTRQAPITSVSLQLQDANIQNQGQRLNAPDIQDRIPNAFLGARFLNGGSGN